MEAEESVEVNHRVARDIDRRPHGVISLLAMRDHDIQTISRASLENDHQPLVTRVSFDGGVSRACKKRGDRSRAHNRQGTIAKKHSTRKHLMQLLADDRRLHSYLL